MIELKIKERYFDTVEIEHLHFQKVSRYSVWRGHTQCVVTPEKAMELIKAFGLKKDFEDWNPMYSAEYYR